MENKLLQFFLRNRVIDIPTLMLLSSLKTVLKKSRITSSRLSINSGDKLMHDNFEDHDESIEYEIEVETDTEVQAIP
ncbi:MAG: hypothetical protein DRH06_09160, partial [Deltaproteobacteria bacterium]